MTSTSARQSTILSVPNTDTAMKFVQIHTLAVDDKTAEVTIKGPTSPMLAAQAVTKSDDFKKIPMTGLYELETEDKELFTTMLRAESPSTA